MSQSRQPALAETPCRPCEQRALLDLVGTLVHAHRLALARIARAEGLVSEDAFDAVQEAFHTFLRMPEARALVDRPDDARKLLVALTRNVARNWRRLHAVSRPHTSDPAVVGQLPDEGRGVEQLLAAAEDQLRLEGCVRTLAAVQRTVVTLRLLDERPGDEVARVLGITPGHVAVLLHRAKANLAACMAARS